MLLTSPSAFGSFSDPDVPNSYFSVTCGTSDSKGAWVEAFASTEFETALLSVEYSSTFVSATARGVLLDVGIGAASSESVLVPDLLVSNVGSYASFRQHFFTFPLRIPSGTRIAIRGQNDQATAGTLQVRLGLFGNLSAPESFWSGGGVERIGAITGSAGVAFTPVDNSAAYTDAIGTAEGDWHILGATTKPCKWFQFAHGISNAAVTNQQFLDVQFGFGDGSTVVPVYRQRSQSRDAEELVIYRGTSNPMPFLSPPVGTTVYVRGQTASNPVDSGYYALAYGVY